MDCPVYVWSGVLVRPGILQTCRLTNRNRITDATGHGAGPGKRRQIGSKECHQCKYYPAGPTPFLHHCRRCLQQTHVLAVLTFHGNPIKLSVLDFIIAVPLPSGSHNMTEFTGSGAPCHRAAMPALAMNERIVGRDCGLVASRGTYRAVIQDVQLR